MKKHTLLFLSLTILGLLFLDVQIKARADYVNRIIPGGNWGNGIMISNHGSLVFEGRDADTNTRDFFMAHPAVSPVGDFL